MDSFGKYPHCWVEFQAWADALLELAWRELDQ